MAKNETKGISAEDHNATRRAVKAKRRSHLKKNPKRETLAQGLINDREEARWEYEEAQAARELELMEFRDRQVKAAMALPSVTTLQKDSLAEKVVLLFLEAFIDLEERQVRGTGRDRFTLATEVMLKQLTVEEKRRHKAIAMGKGVAKSALLEAKRQLEAQEVHNTSRLLESVA